jgi:hypothetical protein
MAELPKEKLWAGSAFLLRDARSMISLTARKRLNDKTEVEDEDISRKIRQIGIWLKLYKNREEE